MSTWKSRFWAAVNHLCGWQSGVHGRCVACAGELVGDGQRPKGHPAAWLPRVRHRLHGAARHQVQTDHALRLLFSRHTRNGQPLRASPTGHAVLADGTAAARRCAALQGFGAGDIQGGAGIDPRQSATRIDGRAEGPILGGHSVKLSNRADAEVSARLLVALFSVLGSFAIDRRAERAVGCCLRGPQTILLRLLTTPVRHPPILCHKRCPCPAPPLRMQNQCIQTHCMSAATARSGASMCGWAHPSHTREAGVRSGGLLRRARDA
jgi:hypothetical protein